MSDTVLAAQTDICVKCGLCLPHCPTYLKTQDENESPRGRLSLIQGWARHELPATPRLIGHVDHCLLCRACESACPAYVPYGQIVDRFRAATLDQPRPRPLRQRIATAALRGALTGKTLAPLAGRLMGGAAAGPLKALAGLAGAGALVDGLPKPSAHALPAPGSYPPAAPETAQAALFLGCTAGLLDRDTVTAALQLMSRLGIRVEIPEGQTCCGALHQHAGNAEEAARQIAQNRAAFGEAPGPAIVSFASGCGAMLSEYDLPAAAGPFRQRVRDLCQFLADQRWPDTLRFAPLPQTVCLHTPCSLRNVLRADRHAARLLKRIPELTLVALPASLRCCGAAGSYMLDHPAMAASLRDAVLEQIMAAQPAVLLTSNPGCAMHLRAGLQQRGFGAIEVLHPVTLLARQLRA